MWTLLFPFWRKGKRAPPSWTSFSQRSLATAHGHQHLFWFPTWDRLLRSHSLCQIFVIFLSPSGFNIRHKIPHNTPPKTITTVNSLVQEFQWRNVNYSSCYCLLKITLTKVLCIFTIFMSLTHYNPFVMPWDEKIAFNFFLLYTHSTVIDTSWLKADHWFQDRWKVVMPSSP